MWTIEFWKAAAERMVRGGAAALLSAWVVGEGVMNALTIDWAQAAGIFLGGAVVSLLMSLVGQGIGPGDGPSFTGQEVVKH